MILPTVAHRKPGFLASSGLFKVAHSRQLHTHPQLRADRECDAATAKSMVSAETLSESMRTYSPIIKLVPHALQPRLQRYDGSHKQLRWLSSCSGLCSFHRFFCCCRCYTWPVGSPPLQQISHGKLHTGHSRTGRHCRATPLDAAAATQDHQVLSQNKRAGEHEQRRHPQSQHVTRCGTGTVTKQGTKAQKAAP
jgi:hypothetical protein